MQTHKTLEDARIAAKAERGIDCIVEIDHATEGRCFIKARVPMKNLESALKTNPKPEILRLIAEHSILTKSELAENEIKLAALREEYLRNNTRCERCGKRIDGNTAYSQQEWVGKHKARAFYCEPCRALLSAIGQGESTDLEERSRARPRYEPYTKEDI